MTPQQPERDPFDGLVLDDEFVRAARKREPSGSDRAGRAAALRARLDAEAATAKRANRLHRRAWRLARRLVPSRNVVTVVVIVVALAGYLWWQRGEERVWSGGAPVVGRIDPAARPTPAPAPSDTPLGEPAAPVGGGGTHRFLATQPGSAAPVTYDPCRPIPVVVNERTMPAAATGLLEEALAEMSAITGLQFVLEGPTDEPAAEAREAFQPDRYGDRWAPVLVAWSDPAEYADLGENVAGVGGSRQIVVSESMSTYVTGIVFLDGTDFEEMLAYDDGRGAGKAVVLHELGHLVGLAHVSDATQLMHGDNTGQRGFADGDLAGLALLGRGACIPEL